MKLIFQKRRFILPQGFLSLEVFYLSVWGALFISSLEYLQSFLLVNHIWFLFYTIEKEDLYNIVGRCKFVCNLTKLCTLTIIFLNLSKFYIKLIQKGVTRNAIIKNRIPLSL